MKLPSRPDRPIQGATTHEASVKTTVGSSGRRGVRHQKGKTNLHKSPVAGDAVKTTLKDRQVSKAAEVSEKKPSAALKNLTKHLDKLQRAVEECSKPGYRPSKNNALLTSVRTLKGIRNLLGDTGDDIQLKRKLNELLNSRVVSGRVDLTLSDCGRSSKLINLSMDAPTRALLEGQAAELLTRAQYLLKDSASSYSPTEYTAPFILENARQGAFIGDNGRFSDDSDVSKITDWNSSYKRTSHAGPIAFDENGRPLNPMGKTGVTGRGALGLWGPNHAADSIVTRPGANGATEVLLIQRKDTGQWALPGGMVEDEKDVFNVALKELAEEALVLGSSTGAKELHRKTIDSKVEELKQFQCFQGAKNTFKGVVDDPRNTDNAWMETEAWSVHLGPEEAAALRLQAGDDARDARWVPVTPENIDNLYANHSEIIRTAPVIQQALEATLAKDSVIADGVMPSLDSIDDSDVSVNDVRVSAIPTPPPPPPLPGGQAVDSLTAKPRPAGANEAYDAVVEELKQKLLEKGGPIEARDPGVVVAPQQATVSSPVTGRRSDPGKAQKAEASRGYDAVIKQLKEELLKRSERGESESLDSIRAGADAKMDATHAADVASPADKPQSAAIEQTHIEQSNQAVPENMRDELIAELKDVLRKRKGSVAPDDNSTQTPDEPSPVAEGDEKITGQDISPEQKVTEKALREIRKNNYDAVIEELKTRQRLTKERGTFNSTKGDNSEE